MKPLAPPTPIADVLSSGGFVSSPTKRPILAVKCQLTQQYGRVEVEESYEPNEEFQVAVGDSRFYEVSVEPTRRWRTVFVGAPEQADREHEAWKTLMEKSIKRR